MRHLLALLDGGTRGTLAEPSPAACEVREKSSQCQNVAPTGTFGTRGTLEIDRVVAVDDFAQRMADLADAYHERIAIVLEAGDIGEAEARRIAEAEIGAAFARVLLPGEVAT
jgi:hypothetical protein